MASPNDTIACVIVTFNSSADIISCVESALASPQITTVLVMDNDSTDDTLLKTRSIDDDRVQVIANTANVGFARAVNAAVKLTQASHVLLLNPDCVLMGGAVEALTEQLADGVGVVAPSISHPSGRLTVRSAGYEPSITRLLSQTFGLPAFPVVGKICRGFNLYAAGEDYPATKVHWVSGACMLVRRSLWDELGAMSERWFMYGEDLEFCHRIRAHGYRVLHSSTARAQHLVGASSAGKTGPVWTLWVDNLVDYYLSSVRKGPNYERVWRYSLAALFTSRALRYRLLAMLSGSPSREVWLEELRRFRAYSAAARGRA